LKGKSKPEIEDFDELIQKIVKKLFSFLEYHIFVEKERKGYGTIALNAIAAYLCNLGGEFKEMEEKCRQNYLSNIIENEIKLYATIKDPMGIEATVANTDYIIREQEKINEKSNFYQIKAREIADKTIKEYNENKIEKEVLKAIREAWDIEKAQKKNGGTSSVDNKLFEIEEDDLDILGEF
uniref:Uncharacterized protein n=1 Tax=Meloidogyne floridensis TaxID=298350 RepID=A0A915NY00_9BILA